MDFNAMITTLESNFNPLTAILFVLFLTSELLGAIPSVKVSSVYQLVVAVLGSIKAMLWPKTLT